MALFKINKGLAENLAKNMPYAKEGFAYFTKDDGKFYIDIDGDGTTTKAEINVNRIPLNAAKADIATMIQATAMATNDSKVYPILAFNITDSTKNLVEAKYSQIGIKNGTLVIPSVEDKNEVLISNEGGGRGIVIEKLKGPTISGYNAGIEIINETSGYGIEIKSGPGIKVAQDPTENLELTTKQYVDNKLSALLGANDALVFKGIIDGEHPLPTTGYEVGHTYRVNAAGTYAGQKCEQGDLIICIADALSTSTSHWTVAQTNIDGAVIGPGTSTANAVPTFADETGKVIKDNPAVTIGNTGLFTAPYIATGDGEANYFQSRKFRGEGDANTYYHAVDFGYAGHNQVDFHEYGGTWNFYENTKGTAADGKLVASIKPDGFHGNLKGNADTATTATSATTATKITQTVVQDTEEGNYPLLLANNGQTATTTGATYFDKSVTLNPKTNTITANINGTADKVANNLIIQLNNGTTEETNKFTYNGSAEKTINITSSSIGAASSSHNHDSSYVKKSGDTMTGDLKFQKTNSDGTTSTTATIGATTGYITGTWLQTTSVGYKAGDFATIDGSGWIYKRTAAQARQDMGLSTAMHFIGKATVDITDGSTVDPKINGYTTKTAGDVIIDKNSSYEYVWTLEGKWECLGPDGSYSVVGHTHDDSYVIKSGDTMSGTLRVLKNGIGSDLNNDGVSLANNSILLCSGGYEDYEYFQLGGTSQRPDIFIDRPGNPITLTPSLPRDENIPSEAPALSIRGNNLQNGFTFYIDKLIDPQNSHDTGMGKIWLRSLTNQAVQLKGICGPTEDEDAANKYYVDNQISTKNTNLMGTVSRTYVKKAGDTMTGNLAIEKSSNSTSFTTTRTDTGSSISFMVGSDGTNRGVYDNNLNAWIIYSDGTDARTQLKLYGAVWNDYAEFREGDTIDAGRCVVEVGNDTLITSTERMMPGANITSDTFGFAIGETKQAKTPVAVSGRVLAYPYESREEFKKNIGRPVCSGPNGTVSIMTDEEYRDKGYCAIGTISAVPDYEEWGTGKVKVNGRVWIKVF